MLIRRFFAFVVSLFILFSLPLNAANAASSWNITGATSAGARSIVNATKAGFKSAVNIMPTGARFGLRLIRVGNTAALLYSAAQVANDGFDFVLDKENNSIKYKVRPDFNVLYKVNFPEVTTYHSTKESACRAGLSALNAGSQYVYTYVGVYSDNSCQYSNPLVGNRYVALVGKDQPLIDKVMPVPTAANQILKNAQNGDSDAQALAREAAVEMVIAGDFDADLLSGAVPLSDNKPLVPSVPGNQNGNVTHGADIGANDEGGMSGATPGQQSDAAKDAADAAAKAAAAAKDAAKAAAEAASKAADDAEDLVNSGADAAEKAAAEAAAKAAAQAAKDAAAAATAAGERAAATAAAAERAAAAATAAAKAAAEKAAKDLADAIAAGEQAAIDAAKAAADAAAKELAEAKEKQAAAEKAADRAKAEAAKPFELPAFCTWAAPVCDFIDWFKEPPPADIPAGDVPFATTNDIGLDSVDRFEQRVDFRGQCPANDFSVSILGVTYSKPIPYHYFCGFLEQIAPWLLAMCYLGTAYFVVENV